MTVVPSMPHPCLPLKSGQTKSCGCMTVNVRGTKHGMSGSSEYGTWRAIRSRCEKPEATSYLYYGGRGIKVCERWRESFENFFADMGLKPTPKHTIDRIDNSGNYEPGNCEWKLMAEQAINKRKFRSVTSHGVIL